MKNLNNYILEKLNIKDIKRQYNYFPKTKEELRKILEERLKDDKDADLNDIDVSEITNMGYKGFLKDCGLFEGLDPHDIDISRWDVSKVRDMSAMFFECENFNCDLSKWDVSNVTDMYAMFNDCKNFTGEGLENWNVSNVKRTWSMFYGCKSLINSPSWYK